MKPSTTPLRPDLANELLQMIQQTDFTDPERRQKGGSEGGAGGYGEKGKGIGKGGSSRAAALGHRVGQRT